MSAIRLPLIFMLVTGAPLPWVPWWAWPILGGLCVFAALDARARWRQYKTVCRVELDKVTVRRLLILLI